MLLYAVLPLSLIFLKGRLTSHLLLVSHQNDGHLVGFSSSWQIKSQQKPFRVSGARGPKKSVEIPGEMPSTLGFKKKTVTVPMSFRPYFWGRVNYGSIYNVTISSGAHFLAANFLNCCLGEKSKSTSIGMEKKNRG